MFKNSKMLKNTSIMFIFLLLIELIFRFVSGIKLWDISLIRVSIFCLIVATLISFILSWCNKIWQKIIMIFLSLLFTIYAFLQLGFNNFIGVYMSVHTSSQLGAVVDYIREFLASFLPKYYLIFIPFSLLLIFLIFFDKFFNKKVDKKFVLKKNSKYEYQIRVLSTAIVLIVLGLGYYGTLTTKFMQNELQTVSNKELFKNPTVPSIVINEFGILGFGFLDIKSIYVTNEEELNIEVLKPVIQNTARKFDDSAWQKVIEEEKNSTLASISNYLINSEITDYNEYTGLFKDKNLIVIMMESVNDIFINPEYYPNFYKLYSEGWAFTNNYSPRNACSTGNNEFSGMTGIYSIYNNCTANIYRDNTYSTSIFNLFNEAGYRTSSMHDYTEAYYRRRTIHKNLGSGKYYGVQDLGIHYYNEYKNWASDEDFMEKAMDITLTSDDTRPFMLWLTTVSSHQPYVVDSEEGNKYIDLFNDKDYSKDLKRYMSKLKTLDNGLGILLEKLEASGELDDTVIVLYGDHYPYGLSNDTLSEVLTYDLEDYEKERVPFVIYNSATTPKKFSQYTSYVNLTPTIANLFGLNYDPRLYMGSDLLGPEYDSLVVFADGSWKNEKAYYNASNGNIIYYKDDKYTIEEIKEINNKVNLKIQISSLIIKNNYFMYLDERLKSVQENLDINTVASVDKED